MVASIPFERKRKAGRYKMTAFKRFGVASNKLFFVTVFQVMRFHRERILQKNSVVGPFNVVRHESVMALGLTSEKTCVKCLPIEEA